MSTNQHAKSDCKDETLAQSFIYLMAMPADPVQPSEPLVAVAAESTPLQLQGMPGGIQWTEQWPVQAAGSHEGAEWNTSEHSAGGGCLPAGPSQSMTNHNILEGWGPSQFTSRVPELQLGSWWVLTELTSMAQRQASSGQEMPGDTGRIKRGQMMRKVNTKGPPYRCRCC